MNKKLYKYSKTLIKQAFPKYKKVQVGATIKEVILYKRKRVGRCIGTQIFDSFREEKEVISMKEFVKVYNENHHQLYVAVDQRTNTVYWNYEKLPSK